MGEAKHKRRQYKGMDVFSGEDYANHEHDPHKHDLVVERIGVILSGRGPLFQAGVLAELLATFIACHPPDLREETLTRHIEAVRDLVPVIEKIKFGEGGFPSPEALGE